MFPTFRTATEAIHLPGRHWAVVFALSCCLGVREASPQGVKGFVNDESTGRPVVGAFVRLIDLNDLEIARTLTDEAGEFGFADPTLAGWLVVERISYPDVRLPDPVTADGGPYRLSVAGSREGWHHASADSGGECMVDPARDSGPAVVWEEVRKALTGLRWSRALSDREYGGLRFDRVLDSTGLVLTETARPTSGLTAPPGAGLAPALIDSLGFVVMTQESGIVFALPTPDVLLSRAFRTTHCMAVGAAGSDSNAVELSFRALPSNPKPDITGTFRLDRESGELRSLEYVYTGLPLSLAGPDIGGHIGFLRLEGGEWLVREWEQTTPGEDGLRRKVGGVVNRVAAESEVQYEDQQVTVLRGTVFDSAAGGPLPGAIVALPGTDVWTTTDADGAFFITGYFDGRYDVVFGHRRLDSLGFIATPTPVHLRPRETATLQLAVPPLDWVVSARCPGFVPTPLTRVVFGVVRDEGGHPVVGADVTAAWQTIPRDLQGFAVDDREATAVTDTLGTYTLCGVAVGRTLVVHAASDDRLSDFVSVLFDGGQLRLGRGRGVLDDRLVARVDLTLATSGQEGAVRGTVTEAETDEPIDRVEVLISGTTLSAVTDAAGRFELRGLPPGAHRLTARRVGYRQVRTEFELGPGEELEVSNAALAMPGGAMELAPIVVEAEAVPAAQRHLLTSGFLDRRNQGLGRFVTRDEFENWRPTETTDVIRRAGGVRVTANPSYGFNGDTRKYLIGTSRELARLDSDECPAIYFVDGVYYGTSADPSAYIDTILSVGTIEAIEIYNGPSQTPARFNRPGADCGVIVFWTR